MILQDLSIKFWHLHWIYQTSRQNRNHIGRSRSLIFAKPFESWHLSGPTATLLPDCSTYHALACLRYIAIMRLPHVPQDH